MDITDKAGAVRKGEELETDKVRAFLMENIPGLEGDLTIRQFPAGFSNLTYLIRVGEKEMVLRRPPFGTKAKTAHDMGREYRILKALNPVFPYCPRPLVYEGDSSILGSPFYIMERLHGIVLHKDLPPGLLFTRQEARVLCECLLDVQLQLHSIDYEKIGLEGIGKPAGYVRRQVVGWSERYRAARTPDAPHMEQIMAWILEKMPEGTQRPAIIHNDFKFDNVLLDPEEPTKIIGVFDWEMATLGDPLMDLGNSLAYWVQRDDPHYLEVVRLMPTNMEGAMTRDELVRRYARSSGRAVEHMDFYYCFGLFRLAVIAQQIYYRFYNGQTQDERFRTLILAVKALETRAREAMERSSL